MSAGLKTHDGEKIIFVVLGATKKGGRPNVTFLTEGNVLTNYPSGSSKVLKENPG